jgi:hypothetical protein
MPRISVWFPDHIEGDVLEVLTYGLFENKSINDVDFPLYVRDPETGDLVETDYLVVGTPIPEEEAPKITVIDNVDEDGGNE